MPPKKRSKRGRGGRAGAAASSARAASGAGWRHLPDAIVLEVCRGLDAAALARLEIARGLGDAAERAWRAATNAEDRGGLAMLSGKAYFAADARATALHPTSFEMAWLGPAKKYTLEQSWSALDAFVFSIGVFWQDEEDPDEEESDEEEPDICATFDYMRADVPDRDLRDWEFSMECPDEAPGHDAMAPMLAIRIGEVPPVEDGWDPIVVINVIRIRDGAACQIARFKQTDGVETWSGDGTDEEVHKLSFEDTSLELFPEDERCWLRFRCMLRLHFLFKAHTGRIASFHVVPVQEAESMNAGAFAGLLHQKLDAVGT